MSEWHKIREEEDKEYDEALKMIKQRKRLPIRNYS